LLGNKANDASQNDEIASQIETEGKGEREFGKASRHSRR